MALRFVLHDFNDDDDLNVVPDADPVRRASVGKVPEYQSGAAYILDQRDNSVEEVRRSGATVHEARSRAFESASEEAASRNTREAEQHRFVPLRTKPKFD